MAVAKVNEGQETASLVSKDDIGRLVEKLALDYRVIGPVSKGDTFVFEEVSSGRDLRLDYRTTVLPPRKFLQRPQETILSFDKDVVTEIPQDARPQVLFGIHPCDVRAIRVLDRVFSHGYEDPYYLSRRQNTLIVALNCVSAGENCFCSSVGEGPELREGYDLLLTDLGEDYLVEVGSPAGQRLLSRWDGLRPASEKVVAEKEKRLNEVYRQLPPKGDLAWTRQILASHYDHPEWQGIADECLACGTCTMVCPTCFCFGVKDRLELDLKSGERLREWDSCLFKEYSEVAQGHNFRPHRETRLKQRLYHKLYYTEEQAGIPGCVGCGRCVTECPKAIHPLKTVARLKGG